MHPCRKLHGFLRAEKLHSKATVTSRFFQYAIHTYMECVGKLHICRWQENPTSRTGTSVTAKSSFTTSDCCGQVLIAKMKRRSSRVLRLAHATAIHWMTHLTMKNTNSCGKLLSEESKDEVDHHRPCTRWTGHQLVYGSTYEHANPLLHI